MQRTKDKLELEKNWNAKNSAETFLKHHKRSKQKKKEQTKKRSESMHWIF